MAAVVVELAALDGGAKLGGKAGHPLAGDELDEVERVRSDVAERAGQARTLWIDAPLGLLADAVLGLGQPPLRIFHRHPADCTEAPAGDQLPRLPRHRVAGVGVGDTDESAGPLTRSFELERCRKRVRQRLVAQHRKARFQRRDRRGCVDVVGRHDRDELGAVRAAALTREQILEAGVAPLWRKADGVARAPGAFGIAAERTGNQLAIAGDCGGRAVDRPDERALTAADHCISNRILDEHVAALDVQGEHIGEALGGGLQRRLRERLFLLDEIAVHRRLLQGVEDRLQLSVP
jgi:hypothetical protein